MENTFNSKQYINSVAAELIFAFDSANSATTPVLVGTAKEKAVMKKLEMLLPHGAGIGTGCVIGIGKPTVSKFPAFPFLHTVRATFTAHGAPTSLDCNISYF